MSTNNTNNNDINKDKHTSPPPTDHQPKDIDEDHDNYDNNKDNIDNIDITYSETSSNNDDEVINNSKQNKMIIKNQIKSIQLNKFNAVPPSKLKDLNNKFNTISHNKLNDLNKRVTTMETSMKQIGSNIQTILKFIKQNNDKRENDDDESVTDTVILDTKDNTSNIIDDDFMYKFDDEDDDMYNNNNKDQNQNQHIHIHKHSKNHNKYNNNNRTMNKHHQDTIDNFIKEAKQYITINFIEFAQYQKDEIFTFKHLNNNNKQIATNYELNNNVILESNYKQPIPEQLLSQAIENDIYATEGIADDDIRDNNIECERDRALKNVSKTLNWKSNIINPDETAIRKLLNATIDPSEHKHDDATNVKNKDLAQLVKITDDNKISLNIDGINSIKAADIIIIDNIKMIKLYDDIHKQLIYDKNKDETIKLPNDRVKNGPTVLYGNVPKLNDSHINRINITIGNPGNRFKLDPDGENTLHIFGKLVCISTAPKNRKLHWDLINTPFQQLLTLQCIRNILFNLNIKYNNHSNIDKIKKDKLDVQPAKLSSLADTLCSNRKLPNTSRDIYWVTNKQQWTFCREMINGARKIHIAIGNLNKKLFKYGCGKRLLHRTNWDIQALPLVGDVNQQRQKTLCLRINNMKRSYELQISECILTVHFEATIALINKLQRYIKYSDNIDTFCATLAYPETVEFNENLLAMFKKTEIAISQAMRSVAQFRLDLMKITRDMLDWYTLIKCTANAKETDARKAQNKLKNDINIANLIINGELRGSDQRKDKLTHRLIEKYKNGPNTYPNNRNNNRNYNNYNHNYNDRYNRNSNGLNNNNDTNNDKYNRYNNNNNNNNRNLFHNRYKRRKLNNNNNISNIDASSTSSYTTTNTSFTQLSNNNLEEINDDSALKFCENMFDKAGIFNTNNNDINNKRINIIRNCLNTFNKEDIIQNQKKRYPKNINTNRKRNFNQMNNKMDTNKYYDNYNDYNDNSFNNANNMNDNNNNNINDKLYYLSNKAWTIPMAKHNHNTNKNIYNNNQRNTNQRNANQRNVNFQKRMNRQQRLI